MLAGSRDESVDAAAAKKETPVVTTPAVTDPAVTDPAVTDPAGTGPAGTGPGAALEVVLDELAAAAVELARAAAVQVAGPAVGEHLGVEADDDRLVTHSFATTEAGYIGWRWAVTVARAEGAELVTVDEVVLLPGSRALLAPAWVPWSERVQPSDLNPGDLLPPVADDPRLIPSYADVDAEQLPFALHRELGLFRPRVLSREGRADAAERWLDGPTGPASPMAKAAPGHCGDCGFLAPLAGALGGLFGACANAMAPDDGRVVALDYGCGAHSETVVEAITSTYAGMAVEDDEFEVTVLDVEGSEAQVPEAEASGVEVSDLELSDVESAAVAEPGTGAL